MSALEWEGVDQIQVGFVSRSADELCDQVASALVPAPTTRQGLLEELDVERRLQRLVGALDALLSQLTGEGGRA